MSQSTWVKWLADRSNIRAVEVQATSLVEELIQRHKLNDRSAEGLGEACIGLLLIASAQKPGKGNRLNLSVKGTGYFRQAVVDAYPEGHVRGYIVENDSEDIALMKTEQMGPWGRGTLSVLYTKYEEQSQPYIGSVPLLTGYLDQDLTHYWIQSAQLPSVVGLHVKVKDGKVLEACGLLVQTLGPASQEERRDVMRLAQSIHTVTEEAGQKKNLGELLSKHFNGSAFTKVENSLVKFQCTCSLEKVENALLLTGLRELAEMVQENKNVEMKCDFCNTDYVISTERLKALIIEDVDQ